MSNILQLSRDLEKNGERKKSTAPDLDLARTSRHAGVEAGGEVGEAAGGEAGRIWQPDPMHKIRHNPIHILFFIRITPFLFRFQELLNAEMPTGTF